MNFTLYWLKSIQDNNFEKYVFLPWLKTLNNKIINIPCAYWSASYTRDVHASLFITTYLSRETINLANEIHKFYNLS